MPNHRSAAKRMRQNIRRNARNNAFKSRMRTALKKARKAITEGSEHKDQLVHEAIRVVQRASSKNVIHRATAQRTVSRLQRASNRANA
ncbi:MAG TPA: 30S ribosomal protein S20 [Myxococcales bacterium LLY-WYZ-16_1]|nr:30S ribosomal protein S20 [Myxococcales bacterium LLY-WYZ-16_1]